MTRRGEKQRKKPKLTDKRQSEQFKEVAREVGADESSDAFERAMDELAPPKAHPKKD